MTMIKVNMQNSKPKAIAEVITINGENRLSITIKDYGFEESYILPIDFFHNLYELKSLLSLTSDKI